MDIAEQKLIYLSQGESFPIVLKLLRADKVITRNSRIAKYSPFIGPAGILRSTKRISRLVNSDFDSKHPIILDARHAVVRLLVIGYTWCTSRGCSDYQHYTDNSR